ncbi:SRPBCC family protein [Roseibacillus persicicus]|uniref:SRPBCC family protein n=1 Tax=Roseibacillus persicicus TaxID=454148 RepID=UPI00280CE5D9|nr:SRPBCC family protein [Roseibacillus persicicus]MDQ8191031.1 SRPBCC family protein [Roseibacillus persicicus]
MEHIVQEQFLPISRAEAWEFFSHPLNLDKITPDELGFSTVSCPDGAIYPGAIIIHRLQLAPFLAIPWVTEIKAVDEGFSFVDEQRFGPYRFWHHRHSFEETEGGVLIRDEVHWKAPFEPFSAPVKALFVKPRTLAIFEHRKQVLADYFSE